MATYPELLVETQCRTRVRGDQWHRHSIVHSVQNDGMRPGIFQERGKTSIKHSKTQATTDRWKKQWFAKKRWFFPIPFGIAPKATILSAYLHWNPETEKVLHCEQLRFRRVFSSLSVRKGGALPREFLSLYSTNRILVRVRNSRSKLVLVFQKKPS